MKHSIKHSLPIGIVRTVTKKAIESYQEKFSDYEPVAKWTGDNQVDISFVALKKKLDGSIGLYDDRIDLELDVPFMFKPFQGKALGIIETEIKKWISKAESGELETEETSEENV